MTQGTCKTNQTSNSIHKQQLVYKNISFVFITIKQKKGDDKAFQRASNHCLSQLKLANCGDNFVFKEYKVTSGQDFKKCGQLFIQN